MIRICVIEDEEKVSSFIKKGLNEHGYEVDIADTGETALEMVQASEYNLVILDVMLPDMSGIEICRQVRKHQPQLPVLMLSALGTIDDKVNGLHSGADDYLVKPFHFNELLARIEALLRRKKLADGDTHILSFGGLKLNTWDKTAEREGKQINLTAKEYSLLELLMNNPGKLLSREYIMERVWGINFDTGTNMVDVYVNYLRNKIQKGFDKKLIHTVIGMGYILKD
ncbi:response regulator transcription factor [Mucilaginibacter phyllosphaerae]|uniref:DNA-binding response OmpR family regulator n=1 Tax=Mucilaginibacter phyllosphaerae TaxID=1812349 RepID=A0A4Y8AB71_9SPHI|nr:response regulator transcription factor [Mucilaginibacter phyllosphaerae]MBB3969427.1 DNA-binding response OmpR family regulator [Mucilaginibacter phyllosphaerae]TEW65787.1 response regulator transcription factor [Mucilaginibacter phyllosphaerae]GGH08470.1 DNA-binding response regulator [Mucilaginibacter phyllosphaerae]